MIIKILWAVIGLNTAALLAFILYFFVEISDRNLGQQELGWTVIIIIVCAALISLAALPIYLSKSVLSISISAFFAFLPLSIWLYTIVAKKISLLIPEQTEAEVYYTDKTQLKIASAIEKGDYPLVKELIKGQDLNIQGNRVWDWDGLNYLQFAIRLRTSQNFKGDTAASDHIIRLLTNQGSPSTRAMAEGIKNLPIALTAFLLDSGADPNTHGFTNADPLLFSAIGSTEKETEVAILLVRKGAQTDTKNKNGLTPLIYAVNNAGTSSNWFPVWRLVRFLLEEKHVHYNYTTPEGIHFKEMIEDIQRKSETENVSMPADFTAVIKLVRNEYHTDK